MLFIDSFCPYQLPYTGREPTPTFPANKPTGIFNYILHNVLHSTPNYRLVAVIFPVLVPLP
ncbi:hypothetical protein NIES39_L03140 [Arthrospira platensis NIES-39]|nr:hypothetical protein NIES39_L03140 [Arthrospira platensis NIES-39]